MKYSIFLLSMAFLMVSVTSASAADIYGYQNLYDTTLPQLHHDEEGDQDDDHEAEDQY